MDIEAKTKRIISTCFFVLILIMSVVIFVNSYKQDYKTYYEKTITYKGIDKILSDGDISIIIKTVDKKYRINNIIANYELYELLNSWLNEDDEILIYYYDSNQIIGIKKRE